MITGLACSLSVSLSPCIGRWRARTLHLRLSSSSFFAVTSSLDFLRSFTIYFTNDIDGLPTRDRASFFFPVQAAPWNRFFSSLFHLSRYSGCPIFPIFAHRILRSDGAKREEAGRGFARFGTTATVVGRSDSLADLSPAPSPGVPLNNNFDRQIGVVHISALRSLSRETFGPFFLRFRSGDVCRGGIGRRMYSKKKLSSADTSSLLFSSLRKFANGGRSARGTRVSCNP